MAEVIQSCIIVFIETICCIIFCEIFGKKESDKENFWLSRWMIVIYLR